MCGALTLDPDVQQLMETVMAERGLTLSEAVNEAIRHSTLVPRRHAPGHSEIQLDKALSIAFEDAELVDGMRPGS